MLQEEALKKIKSAIESMLFVWGQPLDTRSISIACECTPGEAKAAARELINDYEAARGGLRIREMDGNFQMVTAGENREYIEKLCAPAKTRKLSQATLEVLAIIAYRQPVTRVDIEAVRGIKSEKAIESLVKRDLIEEKDRSEAVGRPILYGTTRTFLEKFGISSLKELPAIEDIEGAVRDSVKGVAEDELAAQMRIEL